MASGLAAVVVVNGHRHIGRRTASAVGRTLWTGRPAVFARKIEVTERQNDKGGREIVVQGVELVTDRSTVVNPGLAHSDGETCHPFCRSGIAHKVKHTDVLILRQFMDSEGKPIPREVTGLCRRQHVRVEKLIKMAAKAGLFPPSMDMFRAEKETQKQWASLNSYWDEASIDVQYLEGDRRRKISSFKS